MIGDLKDRVVIQAAARAPDGGGGWTETWQNIAATPEVYASIVPVSGGEQLKFHKLESSVTHRIVIRHRSDITTAMRFVKGAHVYDIKAVTDQDGRGIYLEILALERTL